MIWSKEVWVSLVQLCHDVTKDHERGFGTQMNFFIALYEVSSICVDVPLRAGALLLRTSMVV